MDDVIQLPPLETDLEDVGTDNHGMGSDYYRRKQKPTEPYYVEKLDLTDSVLKAFPNRDFDVEQYIVNQAIQRGQDPNRPFQKTLRGLDWSRGNDKVRTEYWDPQGSKRMDNELGYYRPYSYNNQTGGVFKNLVNNLQYWGVTEPDPVIRMFNTSSHRTPYIHEFAHHLYNFQDSPPDPRKVVKMRSLGWPKDMDSWLSKPSEIQAEASAAKRRYVHREVPNRVKLFESIDDPPLREHVKSSYNVEPFDKDHPAIKEGKPIPDDVMDDMFKSWMQGDDKGWGESYRKNPEEFPVELFKEALRLGKKDQKPETFSVNRSYYA